MKAIVWCEKSQIVTRALREHGVDAVSCDILPCEHPEWAIPHIQDDALNHLTGYDLAIGHPPCTYLTLTGNKWFNPEYRDRFPTREVDREQAVNFFMAFANANIPHICIENPLGIMSTRWRSPDQIIQPFYFGHTEPKKTCLWLKELPPLRYGAFPQMMLGELTPPIPTEIKTPEYITFSSGKRMGKWYVEAGKEKHHRSEIRSRTFQGIADAMASQWVDYLMVKA